MLNKEAQQLEDKAENLNIISWKQYTNNSNPCRLHYQHFFRQPGLCSCPFSQVTRHQCLRAVVRWILKWFWVMSLVVWLILEHCWREGVSETLEIVFRIIYSYFDWTALIKLTVHTVLVEMVQEVCLLTLVHTEKRCAMFTQIWLMFLWDSGAGGS